MTLHRGMVIRSEIGYPEWGPKTMAMEMDLTVTLDVSKMTEERQAGFKAFQEKLVKEVGEHLASDRTLKDMFDPEG